MCLSKLEQGDLDPENKNIIARIEIARKGKHPVKNFLRDLKILVIANYITKSKDGKKSFSFTVSGKHIFITRKSFVDLSLFLMVIISLTGALFNKAFMGILSDKAKLNLYLAITLLLIYISLSIMGIVLYNWAQDKVNED